ncbi:MAG: thioredoxin domain-containing protein [Bacteroidia bacterium]|nr:thioredoxin domain-containing protein [Bacteroidia bacterium]
MNTNSNKLSESSSPYLLQHSENPVHWQEYSDTLINHPENKQLLIISIGYSACHWCHVMEHESFEDAEVAQLMNHHFINIKVDREEHPQVDKVYMQACRLMTGGGGWPLNVICTPDGTPVHAGTYFPKNNWIQLLNTIAKLWKEKPSQVEEFKAKLTSVLIEDNKKESTDLSLVKVLESIDKNTGLLDYNNGGLMGSPK